MVHFPKSAVVGLVHHSRRCRHLLHNGVEGVMIVNTADYRCTFKTDPRRDVCYEILLDVRSADFLREVNRLFQTYPTENPDGAVKMMTFGNDVVRVDEDASRTSRFRSFKFTFAR